MERKRKHPSVETVDSQLRTKWRQKRRRIDKRVEDEQRGRDDDGEKV